MTQLRPYQIDAIDRLRAEFRNGHRAVLLCIATGGGKTLCASEIIRSAVAKSKRCIFLAHRTEILSQTVAKLALFGVTNVRVIQAENDIGPKDAPVIVASIQTLTRRVAIDKVDLIILDECHHGVCGSWTKVTDTYPAARLLGLTATPIRGDRRPLGDMFQSMVIGETTAGLTRMGYLVPCVVYAPPSELGSKQAAMSVRDAYDKHGDGQPAIVFCGSIDEARTLAEGIDGCEMVNANMPAADRQAVLERLRSGVTRMVTNCSILDEGFDFPGASVCILTRKVGHVGTFIQRVGRVLRPSPGKTRAILIDLAGTVHTHGLPDQERTFSLDGKGISSDRLALSQCPSCGMCRLAGGACPCGYVAAAAPSRRIDILGIDLEEVAPKLAPREMPFRIITAAWASRCPICDVIIQTGEQVLWRRSAVARHVQCRKAGAQMKFGLS